MISASNIYLVGPMGVGKTTVGRSLAKSLGLEFVDSDQQIEERTGVSISTIFDIEGEEGFRARESKILNNLCQMSNIILATGGGIVILPKNRKILKNSGLVVYLYSSIDQLLRRTAKSKTRPLLENSTDRKKTITELLETRDVYYREVASFVVDTTGKKLHEVINLIIRETKNVE
mgnify:CR=1 FL=1